MKNSSPRTKPLKVLSELKSDQVLIDAVDPISVLLVGAGGTGSLILSNLARMNTVLKAAFNKSLVVTVMDSDIVTPSNIGRQLFSPADLDMAKASALVSRINQFFGFDWKTDLKMFKVGTEAKYNIIISATDSIESRENIRHIFYNSPNSGRNNRDKTLYWLDCGNGKTFGNVILSDVKHKLPNIFDLNMVMNEEESGPSCSLAEAIAKQDMFVNSWVALTACQLLWELLTKDKITWHAAFFNLEQMAFSKRKLILHESKTGSKKRTRTTNRPAAAV